jgi:hypothetical protein
MAKAREVLDYLLPNGGWTIQGEDFDSIVYDDGVSSITKKQFNDAGAIVDQAIADAYAAREAARQSRRAKLLALGLTEDELDA